MSVTRPLHLLLLVLAAVALAACARPARGQTLPPTHLRWLLAQLEDAPASPTPPGREPSLQFGPDGRVTGFTTCNSLFGRYEAPGGGQLRFGELGSTRMACADPALARQEQRFMAALRRVDRFAVEGDTLVLREGDRVVARFVAARVQ